jgi:hypothetical protein
MRKMDKDKIMFESRDGQRVTTGDLLDTLLGESEEAL